MGTLEIKHGLADQSVEVRLVDGTDGTPETGVTSATAGLSIQYRRDTGALVTITPSDLAAVDSAHADGGLKHVRDGYYRVDVPDAACAAGAKSLRVYVTATGMVGLAACHQLVAYDNQSATRGTAGTALPDAAFGGTTGVARQLTLESVQTGVDGLDSTTQAVLAYVDELETRLTEARADQLDNLDAAVSTRMATFTLPANFAVLSISSAGLVTATNGGGGPTTVTGIGNSIHSHDR